MKFFKGIPLFYKEELKGGYNGSSHGFYIVIKEELKGDLGLHMHELRHIRQFWQVGIPFALFAVSIIAHFSHVNGFDSLLQNPQVAFGLSGLFAHRALLKIDDYRYWSEVDAKKEELRYPPNLEDPENALRREALSLATAYDFDISYSQAVKDLKS